MHDAGRLSRGTRAKAHHSSKRISEGRSVQGSAQLRLASSGRNRLADRSQRRRRYCTVIGADCNGYSRPYPRELPHRQRAPARRGVAVSHSQPSTRRTMRPTSCRPGLAWCSTTTAPGCSTDLRNAVLPVEAAEARWVRDHYVPLMVEFATALRDSIADSKARHAAAQLIQCKVLEQERQLRLVLESRIDSCSHHGTRVTREVVRRLSFGVLQARDVSAYGRATNSTPSIV